MEVWKLTDPNDGAALFWVSVIVVLFGVIIGAVIASWMLL